MLLTYICTGYIAIGVVVCLLFRGFIHGVSDYLITALTWPIFFIALYIGGID